MNVGPGMIKIVLVLFHLIYVTVRVSAGLRNAASALVMVCDVKSFFNVIPSYDHGHIASQVERVCTNKDEG